ncbi:ABC transporter ATP-binding protein [Aneurinibacillus sp. Ricciae_BoGa-3]|uniref:ABC transporter ATP-binding protein n=1 Tax=Aneurinibacillus sp. Ricciae_BoGa-3 TaxID=3022697 RepID=UPI002341E658|nr:ABC transporter ATP-binding protein [Aneurinibacillus sp. Ricciae_BoGa-3]WCK52551.1 ABC transporter ATP-binding protein [Aneurinibacillus sp. Ricciae_BoGa-3]
MPVLAAHDIYKFYHTEEDETLALKGVNISIESGEMVALMGPSGSGKSTLLSCLVGLDEPDGGYVELQGNRLTRRPETVRAAVRAKHIGILKQSGNLFNHLTVEENVQLQMKLAKKANREYLNQLIEMVGLSHRKKAYPSQLSGGEAARAGLAVAISKDPSILLADEPTGEVDAQTEMAILELFDQHRKKGGAVLIATHSKMLGRRADRIVHLNDGRVIM